MERDWTGQEAWDVCPDKEWPYEACLRQGLLSVSVAAQSQAWHGRLW